MHIMLFGGSFDPPHKGHISVVSHVLSAKLCDEIWFVPCGSHPFNKSFTTADHRVNMLKSINIPKTKVSLYEVEKEGKSFSLDTLNHYAKKHPEHTFSWLVGSDQLTSFHKWHDYTELLRQYSVFVYPREGYPMQPLYTNMIALKDMEAVPTSSTQIRNQISNGKDTTDQLTPEISQYIKKHSLYNATYASTT